MEKQRRPGAKERVQPEEDISVIKRFVCALSVALLMAIMDQFHSVLLNLGTMGKGEPNLASDWDETVY